MKDIARIMLGKVESGKRLIEEFKLEGYRFRIYSIESAILPHPARRDVVLICKDCIEISWSSWAFLPLYIDPNLLLRVVQSIKVDRQ